MISGTLLRVLIFALIAGAIYFGLRRIWRDWSASFREVDKKRHKRDLAERERPDVVTLKRSDDGVFRAPEDDERR